MINDIYLEEKRELDFYYDRTLNYRPVIILEEYSGTKPDDLYLKIWIWEGLRRYLKKGRDKSNLTDKKSWMDHWINNETFAFLPDSLWR